MKTIPIKCKGNRYVSYKKLKNFQGNLKELSEENNKKLKNLIIEHGWISPVFVWDKNWILDGHGRILVLKELIKEGYTIKDIPIIDIQAKTKKEAAKILLAINSQFQKITEKGLYDFMSGFKFKIEDMDAFKLPEIDFDCFKTNYFTPENQEEIENEVPEVPEKPKTKKGDLYQLGEHTILCGDATNEKDVKRLMNGKKADMVFTDPPYGVSIVNTKTHKVGAGNLAKNKKYAQVIGDDTTDTAKKFYKVCISLGYENFIIWGGNYFVDFLPFSSSWIIWDKRCGMTSNNFADGEMAWCSFRTRVRIYKHLWNGMIREGEKEERVHPTQKPVQMIVAVINDHVKNRVVLDSFLGSGTTLIACEKTNRICYGMEIDLHYTDVCVTRWIKYMINTKQENKIKLKRNGEIIDYNTFL